MKITVHYRAFDDAFDVDVPVPGCFDADHGVLLEELFANTSTYSGPFWNRIGPRLPRNRRHTSLSVGDEITIDSTTYRCLPFGWLKIEEATTP